MIKDVNPPLIIDNVTSVICHEMGHAYGATHVYDDQDYNVKKSGKYIMATRSNYFGQEFHPENQRRMRKLISGVNQFDFDILTVNAMRNKSREKPIFLEDFTAQEASLFYQR